MRLSALAVLPLVGLAAACGGGSSSSVTLEAGSNNALGFIIVSESGMTLYHTARETHGSIACTGACTKTWQPLTSTTPIAGAGLSSSLLGTIKRPDGKTQVTYNGFPLYLYSRDNRAGQARGEGSGGVWYAVTPAGEVAKPPPPVAGACLPGQGIPQGAVGDDDDDNTVGGPSDDDGCL